MYYEEFGTILKRLRIERGLNQEQLGDIVGLSKAVVSKYENSQSYPSFDMLIKLANTFGVSTDYMLGLETRKILDSNGLTDGQIDLIIRTIQEYRKLNRL